LPPVFLRPLRASVSRGRKWGDGEPRSDPISWPRPKPYPAEPLQARGAGRPARGAFPGCPWRCSESAAGGRAEDRVGSTCGVRSPCGGDKAEAGRGRGPGHGGGASLCCPLPRALVPQEGRVCAWCNINSGSHPPCAIASGSPPGQLVPAAEVTLTFSLPCSPLPLCPARVNLQIQLEWRHLWWLVHSRETPRPAILHSLRLPSVDIPQSLAEPRASSWGQSPNMKSLLCHTPLSPAHTVPLPGLRGSTWVAKGHLPTVHPRIQTLYRGG
jgi:hypothetical protein